MLENVSDNYYLKVLYICMEVVTAVRHEGVNACRQTVWRLEKLTNTHGTIVPLRKTGRPTKLTSAALRNIDEGMEEDDETTAKELVTALRGAGVSVSTYIALKGRRLLGWTSRGTAYCQLVRAQNREKRLRWAQEYLGASFHDVIWSDETSVQIEGFVVAKMVQSPATNPALNTLLRFMCGLALAGMEQQERVFLRESWMLISTVKY